MSMKYTTKGKIVIGAYLTVLLAVIIFSGSYVVNYFTGAPIPPEVAIKPEVSEPKDESSEVDQVQNPVENESSGIDNSSGTPDNSMGDVETEQSDIVDDSDTNSGTETYSEKDLNVLREGFISIYFGIQSFDVSENNLETLKSFVELAGKYPDEQIVIEGHSDGYPNFENTAMEVSLASGRIDAVYDVLVQNGIESDMIITVNAGSKDPVSKKESDRSKNDRVDVYFIDHVLNDVKSK